MTNDVQWRVLRGMDFGDAYSDRHEPGDLLRADLPTEILEDLQRRGAISLERITKPLSAMNFAELEAAVIEAGEDVSAIEGTGPGGKVTKDDLLKVLTTTNDNDEEGSGPNA